MIRPRTLVVALLLAVFAVSSLEAGDLRIPLPKKSKYTPVQQLNRDGVNAVQRQDFEKAKKLFYKAYLLDPNDPFTLNNLGYLAELEGDSNRAQRFYQLASEQESDAIVDKASNELVEGKPVSSVAGNADEKGITINRLNSGAIELLEKGRAPEADLLLQKALKVDPRNPFTLNNLGYAREKEGELEAAYQFYTAAANTNSRERVQIALERSWRGKAISNVARDNANAVRKRLRDGDDYEARVALLNLRAVSAFNRNDRQAAREFINQAYKLDPTDAFTLNNMGYLAEAEGDKETADYYYSRALEANRKGERIDIATRKDVAGQQIGTLARNSDELVITRMRAEHAARQQIGAPVMLYRRDRTPVIEPEKPVTSPPKYHVSDENGDLVLPPLETSDTTNPTRGGIAMPLPDSEQPATVHTGPENDGLIGPLPENQQPGAEPPNQPSQPQIQQGPNDRGLIKPLPDKQQPGAQPQNPPPPKQGPISDGILMPLPDSQQPGATPQQTPATQLPNNNRIAQPQPQPQTQPSSSGPGILMPPPDKQQPPKPKQAKPNSPKRLSDTDEQKKQPSKPERKIVWN